MGEDIDEAFVIVSVISGIFGILGLELLTHNWFRKEKFKFQMFNLKKRQDLELKKLARDMGIDTPKTHSSIAPAQGLDSLLGLAKNLPPKTISNIVQALAGKNEEEEEIVEGEDSGLGINSLLDFANKNPELVQGFLESVKGKFGGGGGASGGVSYY